MREFLTNSTYLQWLLLIGSSVGLILISPWARSTHDFFRGSANTKAPGFWLLTSSLVISWLFAKSITNAANLGLSFGIVGGFAYATYYLSFLTAGVIIYRMRTVGGFGSLHAFLQQKFGRPALVIFSLLIGFRLLNEVWSNTMVIGSYFGEMGSFGYYLSIGVFTLLTVAYTLKGGLRSSLLTDLIQMLLFAVLLTTILGVLLPRQEGGLNAFVQSGEWSLVGGLDLMLVALIQVISYPFHDPVLTDRAFIADPKTTLLSFLAATVIGAACILLFSFVGIFAANQGLEGQAPVAVSQLLGSGMMLMMNFIMVTSAASTLDSTFNSFSKLIVLDLRPKSVPRISLGRWVIALIAVFGTLPILFGAEILSATTISGTMVLGLSPVFLFWKQDFPPLSYYLSVGTGMLIGSLYALGWFPQAWVITDGTYATLLSANVLGVILCFTVFFLPRLFSQSLSYASSS